MSDLNKELLKKYEEAKTELEKLKAEIVQKENSLKNLKGYLEAEGILAKPVAKKRIADDNSWKHRYFIAEMRCGKTPRQSNNEGNHNKTKNPQPTIFLATHGFLLRHIECLSENSTFAV